MGLALVDGGAMNEDTFNMELRKFMDKYHTERLSNIYRPTMEGHQHSLKDMWDQLLDVMHIGNNYPPHNIHLPTV